MSDLTNAKRRRLLQTTVGGAAGLAATELGLLETAKPRGPQCQISPPHQAS
jgi:hypothetical protein